MDDYELMNLAATTIQRVYKGFMVRQHVQKLKRLIYYSEIGDAKESIVVDNEYGFFIQPTQTIRPKQNKSHHLKMKQLKRCQQIVYATKLQKYFRGYLSRKYLCDYKKLKMIVLYIEMHVYQFLRKRIQQRKVQIKQLEAQCYNLATSCKQISKMRNQLCRFMNQRTFDSINGTLFSSFLTLLIPNFDKHTAEQRQYFTEQMLSLCSAPPPRRSHTQSKTPQKNRPIVQNISVISADNMQSSSTVASSTKSKSQLTNQQFKLLLSQQKTRK